MQVANLSDANRVGTCNESRGGTSGSRSIGVGTAPGRAELGRSGRIRAFLTRDCPLGGEKGGLPARDLRKI